MIKSFVRLLILKFKLRSVNYVNLSPRIFIGKYSSLITDKSSSINFNENLTVRKFISIKAANNGNIIFGYNVYVGDFSIIQATYADVSIGAHTMIGQQVKLISTNHFYKEKGQLIHKQHINKEKKGIIIGEDCWLGAGCAVMPGVSLGRGVVVGANAVVTKDVPDYAVVVGIPAKIISYRS